MAAKKKSARKKKRPGVTLTKAKFEEILALMSKGETLRSICRRSGFPDNAAVYRYVNESEDRRSAFSRARIDGTHQLADECVEIADGKDDPQRARVRVDTRLRLIGMWNRKDYGAKQDTVEVDTGGAPAKLKITIGGGDGVAS